MSKLFRLSAKLHLFIIAEVVLSRAGHLTPAKKIHKRRKTHVKKKILAIFLSLCMAMSLLPVTVLATGEEAISITNDTTALSTGSYILKEDT